MQSNFWAGSKNLDQPKTFWDLPKDKASVLHNSQKKRGTKRIRRSLFERMNSEMVFLNLSCFTKKLSKICRYLLLFRIYCSVNAF
jgi:hypothetical protein